MRHLNGDERNGAAAPAYLMTSSGFRLRERQDFVIYFHLMKNIRRRGRKLGSERLCRVRAVATRWRHAFGLTLPGEMHAGYYADEMAK